MKPSIQLRERQANHSTTGTSVEAERAVVAERSLPPGLVRMLAVGCAISVANLWYAQPLLAKMAVEWHVSQTTMGTIAGCPLAGYATGMLFFVPLGDIVERRRLILVFIGAIVATLFGMIFAPNITMLGVCAFLLGVASIVPQLIIPYAAGLTEPKNRGSTVGTLQSGILIGLLLSRTVGGVIAEHFGWRAVYWTAIAANSFLLIWFSRSLRECRPSTNLSYIQLIRSMLRLATHEPVLITSAFFGAITFACFNILWTVLSFLLAGAPFNCDPQAIGSFGLMGLAGALTAGYVGKLADTRGPMFSIGIALAGMALSFVELSAFSGSLIGIAIGVLFLDLFVQSSQVSNMARIYSLSAENHSRLATVYMVSYFIGGTFGAWLGTTTWSHCGWSGCCAGGIACAVIGFAAFLAVAATKSRRTT
ncbi:MAG TPA: MFS transporter [Trichormus sp.]|jgi:predicted MFS family arabinose efflux permease